MTAHLNKLYGAMTSLESSRCNIVLFSHIVTSCIDVPQPLINDLSVFLFQKIDAECVKWASRAGTSVYAKAFIVNVNKCLKPYF